MHSRTDYTPHHRPTEENYLFGNLNFPLHKIYNSRIGSGVNICSEYFFLAQSKENDLTIHDLCVYKDTSDACGVSQRQLKA